MDGNGKMLAHARRNPATSEFDSHMLEDHLREVARFAAEFSASYAPREWGTAAGLWHDLGKYRPGFQSYLRSATGLETESDDSPRRIKHAIVGAIHASQRCGPQGRWLAYLIAGHHAGLPDWDPADAPGLALSQELNGEAAALSEAVAGGAPSDILEPGIALPQPPIAKVSELHFWLRMLFSALVDADFLDTERFMNPERRLTRGGHTDISALRDVYEWHMSRSFDVGGSEVNRLRNEIRLTCVDRAIEVPGLFTLTVPTGGGKTLASLGFALHHAAHHGLKRVVYVIPYTSIIEQTADVFRDVFADVDPQPVIEHHSNLDADRETLTSRLAAENWDAPIVVTTSVQFFESLYAAKTSRCRKLHNLAECVIVLDETQLLPPEHLRPILDSLAQLIGRYGTSVVLSTATQPELGKTRSDAFGRVILEGLGEATELAPDPSALYERLRRVTVSMPDSPDERRDWDGLASELEQHPQVLCVVNRRDDAAALWRRLPRGTVHLSARMCGAHRAATIARIGDLLKQGQPVRVVSTQLVEAGVDLDFPVVYRAMAGLDSIAQAAGRCNREGRIPGAGGHVVVFNPPQPSPSGLLLMAEQAAQRVLATPGADPMAPASFSRYFDLLYGDVSSHDKNAVMQLLCAHAANGGIQFRSAAQAFRLIPEEGQQTVLVRWGGGELLIDRLRTEGPHRELMRRLQRFSVTLYDYQLRRLMESGDIVMQNGFVVQANDELYNADLGLLPDVPSRDAATLVY